MRHSSLSQIDVLLRCARDAHVKRTFNMCESSPPSYGLTALGLNTHYRDPLQSLTSMLISILQQNAGQKIVLWKLYFLLLIDIESAPAEQKKDQPSLKTVRGTLAKNPHIFERSGSGVGDQTDSHQPKVGEPQQNDEALYEDTEVDSQDNLASFVTPDRVPQVPEHSDTEYEPGDDDDDDDDDDDESSSSSSSSSELGTNPVSPGKEEEEDAGAGAGAGAGSRIRSSRKRTRSSAPYSAEKSAKKARYDMFAIMKEDHRELVKAVKDIGDEQERLAEELSQSARKLEEAEAELASFVEHAKAILD